MPKARRALRELYEDISLDETHKAILLTILDEIVKNILRHGKSGVLQIQLYKFASKVGFRFVAEDIGRGIEDLNMALQPGYSEDRGMGKGLNLLIALADDVRIASLMSGGTYLEVWKWINEPRTASTTLA